MSGCLNYPLELRALPIAPHLDSICEALRRSPSRFLILTAETAAGKSTALPLALLKNFPGGILMLEPRRLAVSHIAHRVSGLLGEEVGGTCGYAMHLDRKVSGATRFTVLTEAILTRMLQGDPSLAGISVVVLDEFHERSVHADVALAFLKEAVQLRDDLYVIVMSATMDTARLSAYAGTDDAPCPVYAVPGRQFPVDIRYRQSVPVAQAVQDVLRDPSLSGSVLVFLPGLREIRSAAAELERMGTDVEICILHSSVSFEEQRRVLSAPLPGSRRVILSSAIAETSVTVPDVRIVIDSGLCRVNVFNQASGQETLETQVESCFNADQRAGRAGRTGPGTCVRLWLATEPRAAVFPPEIVRADLVPVVLECAEWGAGDWGQIDWLDVPSPAAWKAAQDLLSALGCLSGGKITNLGKACLSVGLHPRLACVALGGNVEKAVRCSSYGRSGEQSIRRAEAVVGRRVREALRAHRFALEGGLLCGFPDRLGVRRQDGSSYLFPTGQVGVLSPSSPAFPAYLVAPELEMPSGSRPGKIISYEPLDDALAARYLESHSQVQSETVFVSGTKKLQKTEYRRYGAIILSERHVPVSDGDYGEAVCAEVRKQGLGWLPLSDATRSLLLRVRFCLQEGALPALRQKHEGLSDRCAEWLLPFLPPGKHVSAEAVHDALWYFLDGDEVRRLAPAEILLENGRKKRLLYEEQGGRIVPVLEVIIQQVFGCASSPQVLGVPVVLRLLSPARRPLQVTTDLAHFWRETWPEICSEMKGRYPRHNWDYRVAAED